MQKRKLSDIKSEWRGVKFRKGVTLASNKGYFGMRPGNAKKLTNVDYDNFSMQNLSTQVERRGDYKIKRSFLCMGPTLKEVVGGKKHKCKLCEGKDNSNGKE